MKKAFLPSGLFDSSQFGYSQVVTAAGDRLVFLAGQVGWDESGEVVSGELVPQAKQAMNNIRQALEAVGGGLADIVMMRTYIVDYSPDYVEELLPVYLDLFADCEPPAQTWLGVQSLALPDLRIEIEAQAVLSR